MTVTIAEHVCNSELIHMQLATEYVYGARPTAYLHKKEYLFLISLILGHVLFRQCGEASTR